MLRNSQCIGHKMACTVGVTIAYSMDTTVAYYAGKRGVQVMFSSLGQAQPFYLVDR